MSKPQVKFHQKILTLSGRKSSDKVSHLGTIRGHLGLKISFLYIIFLDEPFAIPIRKGTIKEAHSFFIELIHSFRLK